MNSQKPIELDALLVDLLAKIEPMDFAAVAYPCVLDLRRELEAASDATEVKRLNAEIKKCTPNDKQRNVVVVEQVIKVAQTNRYGLCKNQAFCYIYNGAYWVEIGNDQLEQFLGQAAEKMGVPPFDARQYGLREQLLRQFYATGFLPTPKPTSEVRINLQNGTFGINGSERGLRPFDAADFIRYQLPFEYDPQAECPMFDTFLNRVLPDANCQAVLAEFLGWLFVPDMKLEKALILFGGGANGKSVFYTIVSALLGKENICNFTMSNLSESNGYYKAMLTNKLLNYSSEMGGNQTNPDTIKQLISNEPIGCRLPYREPFVLEDGYARLAFNANTMPKETEHSKAYFRRFIIIPFTQTIPEAEQDPYLAHKIIGAELGGIFNWVLQGLDRLIAQQRFTESKVINDALNAYQMNSDSVQLFLADEGYAPSTEAYRTQQELFSDYRAYCTQNGYKNVSNRAFGERLRFAGYRTDRGSSGMRVWADKQYIPQDETPF